jgi:hypothetical protein
MQDRATCQGHLGTSGTNGRGPLHHLYILTGTARSPGPACHLQFASVWEPESPSRLFGQRLLHRVPGQLSSDATAAPVHDNLDSSVGLLSPDPHLLTRSPLATRHSPGLWSAFTSILVTGHWVLDASFLRRDTGTQPGGWKSLQSRHSILLLFSKLAVKQEWCKSLQSSIGTTFSLQYPSHVVTFAISHLPILGLDALSVLSRFLRLA